LFSRDAENLSRYASPTTPSAGQPACGNQAGRTSQFYSIAQQAINRFHALAIAILGYQLAKLADVGA
jgi:hypothetical protein